MKQEKGLHCFIKCIGLVTSAISTIGLIWSIKDKRFDDAYICVVGCLIGTDAAIHSSYIDD
jgi:nitrogen fixation-related uncharacterized protein